MKRPNCDWHALQMSAHYIFRRTYANRLEAFYVARHTRTNPSSY